MVLLFPANLHGISRGTVPRSLAIPGSSSRELGLLSRVRRHFSPPAAREQQAPPMGSVRSPSRHRYAESTHRQDPRPAYVPPTVFLTLSTACSSAHLAGLFHPATTSEICSSGAFPGIQPPWLVTSACPHVVAAVCLPPSFPGGADSRRLAFRALIQLPIRCVPAGFLRLQAPDPLLSLCSFGSCSAHLGRQPSCSLRS